MWRRKGSGKRSRQGCRCSASWSGSGGCRGSWWRRSASGMTGGACTSGRRGVSSSGSCASGEAQQKLAEAQQRSEQLHERIQELEQENAGLKQRNQDLLRSPFGKRSEKRQSGSEAGAAAAETARPGADSEPQRPRGGQRGAVPHARVERSGLAVQEEWLEPEAERRYCADCGAPYARNGEESSASIEVALGDEPSDSTRRETRNQLQPGASTPTTKWAWSTG